MVDRFSQYLFHSVFFLFVSYPLLKDPNSWPLFTNSALAPEREHLGKYVQSDQDGKKREKIGLVITHLNDFQEIYGIVQPCPPPSSFRTFP